MAAKANAATYYVDSAITDTNVGSATPDFTTYNPTTFATDTGSASVYKTIADVNLKSFTAGDSILFRRGQAWREQLTVPSSGSSGSPITFGAYGSGALPIISGANIVTPGASWAPYTIPAFIQSKSGYTNTGVTTYPLTFTSNNTAGNLIVVSVNWAHWANDITVSISDSLGNTYQATLARQTVYAYRWTQVFYAYNVAAGANTVTATFSSTAYGTGVAIHEYSGIKNDGNPLDQTSSATGNTDPSNSGSATTAFATELIFGWAYRTGGDNGAGTGFTAREYPDNQYSIDKVVTSIGSYNAIWNATSPYGWLAQMATFQAGGSTTVWTSTVTTEPQVVTFDGVLGTHKTSIGALTAARNWYWASNVLYVYSATDPDTAYTNPGVEVSARNYAIDMNGPDYINIDSISVKQTQEVGINVQINSTNVNITNNSTWGIGGAGSSAASCGIQSKSTGGSVSYNETSYNYYCGIRILGSGITVEYNNIHHQYATWAEGMELDQYSDSSIVRYNLIHDNSANGILFNHSDHNRIYYNLIYGNGTNGGWGPGFVIYDSPGTGNTDNQFLNNTLYNNGGGMDIRGENATLIIKNNIFLENGKNSQPDVRMEGSHTYSGLAIDNNIYYDVAGTVFNYGGTGGSGGTSYTFTNWKGLTIGGIHPDVSYSLNADPLFVSSSDFHIQPGSPAINAGVDVGLTQDYEGNSIYGAPDIGGYDYQPPYTFSAYDIPTTGSVRLYSDGKYMMLNASSSAAVANFSVTPSGGSYYTASTSQYMDITIDSWLTSGTKNKQWTATSSAGAFQTYATSTVYTIGDLAVSTYYQFKLDGTASTTAITGYGSTSCANGICLSDSSGQIQFTYSGGYSTHTFALVQNTDAPTNVGISSISAVSTSQITVIAQTATDADPGLHATPYYFAETTGHDGGSSSSWQNSTTFIDTGLSSNTQYTYQVKAKDGNSNESAYSDTLSKYTLAPTPTNLAGTADLTTMSLSVDSFTNATAGSSGYYFSRSGANSSWITTNSWTDAGLTFGTTYAWQVKYRNGDAVETSAISVSAKTHSIGGGGSGGSGYAPVVPPQTTTKSTQIAQTSSAPLVVPASSAFTNNLKAGFRGDDVKSLQLFLNKDPDTRLAETGFGSPGNETSFFGILTYTSVIKFQEKYAKDILAPWDLTKGTGFVGQTTRAKINQLLGF